MNYGEYMRRKDKERSKLIGIQNAQDASQVTLKNKALATTITLTTLLSTNKGFTDVPFTSETSQTSQTSDGGCCMRVCNGSKNVDTRQNLIGYAQMASISKNIEPRTTLIPCATMLPIIKNAPSTQSCCTDDMGQLFRDPTELIANQALQSQLRTQYKLPNKLQGLRGPVVNSA